MKPWDRVRLGNVCKTTKIRHDGRLVRYIGLEHIESGTGLLASDPVPQNVKSATFRFDDRDLLYGRLRPYLNKVLVPNFEGHCSTEIFPIQCDNSRLERRFLYHWLMSDAIVRKIDRTSTGTRMPRANVNAVLEFDFPLPPLPEQKRIVAILDEAFAAIATATANAEKNLANARELFESHLKGISGQTVPLEDLVNIRTGKLDANAAVEGGAYPFFTCAREVYAIDNYAFDCEAIMLAGNNAVGDFNVKHYKGKFNAYQRTYVVTVNERKRVLYRFLYFQMLNSLKEFKSQSVGAGTKFLKLGMIKGMKIALPARTEQKKIVAKVDSIRLETERLESIYQKKATAHTELKQSILHKAFTGELTADRNGADGKRLEAI